MLCSQNGGIALVVPLQILWLVDLVFAAAVGTRGKALGGGVFLLLVSSGLGSAAILALAIAVLTWVLFGEQEEKRKQEEEKQKVRKHQEKEKKREMEEEREQQRQEAEREMQAENLRKEAQAQTEMLHKEAQAREAERARETEREQKGEHERSTPHAAAGDGPNFADNASLYAVLAIDPSVTAAQVRTAYYKLALRYHPDKSSAEEKEGNSIKFLRISEAYSVLSNSAQREKYDRELKSFDFLPFKGFSDFKVDEEKAAELFKSVSTFFAPVKELTAKAQTVKHSVAGRFKDKQTGQLDWMKLATTVGSNALADCRQQDGGIDFGKASEKLGTLGRMFMKQQEDGKLLDAGHMVLDNLDWLASDNTSSGPNEIDAQQREKELHRQPSLD
jgi:curved DNA-binding protein CbpA